MPVIRDKCGKEMNLVLGCSLITSGPLKGGRPDADGKAFSDFQRTWFGTRGSQVRILSPRPRGFKE